MKLWVFVVLVLGVAALKIGAATRSRVDDLGPVLVTQKAAYALLPPQFVTDLAVEEMTWSPDGTKLVFSAKKRAFANVPGTPSWMKLDGKGPMFLCIFDMISGKLLQGQVTAQYIMTDVGIRWYAHSAKFLVCVTVMSQGGGDVSEVWLVDSKSGTYKVVAHDKEKDSFSLPFVSDKESIAVLAKFRAMEANGQKDITVIDESGTVLRQVSLQGISTITSLNGSTLIYMERTKLSDGKWLTNWKSMNVRTGKSWDITNPHEGQKRAALDERMELKLSSDDDEAEAVGASLLSDFNAGGASSLVVSASATDASLSPNYSAVAYVSEGALFIRPIFQMNLDAYAKYRKGKDVEEYLNKARQAALSIIMYSADYDDVLPPKENWREVVLPYCKSIELLDSFTLTYDGPLEMAKAGDPAKTVLGYVQLPDGRRAVAYLDGHTVLEPAKILNVSLIDIIKSNKTQAYEFP